MATLFDPNWTRARLNLTEPDETHQYSIVLYRTGLVHGLLDGPEFRTIFHGQAIPVPCWYGSVYPEPDGSRWF